jgi:hypothetical protein
MATAVNLVLIFKAISKIFEIWSITSFSTGGWLAVAVFFPIANLMTRSQITSVPVFTLWVIGNTIGMMWWP